MNTVSLIGRITRDLELKSFNEGNGFYTKFTGEMYASISYSGL
jgi:single-stranded DNA-binding protein